MTTINTLSACVDKSQPPYVDMYNPGIDGNAWRLYPGKYLQTPNVWQLESCRIHYTASADVANRYMVVRIIDDKDTAVLDGVMSSVIVANDNYTLIVSKMGFVIGCSGYSDEIFGIGENAFVFYPGWRLEFITVSGHANDVIAVTVRVKYLNYDLGINVPRYAGDTGNYVSDYPPKSWSLF